MVTAPPGAIGMADLWKQGQNTQERLAKLEVIVERLAKVDERLDSHSGRLRDLEGATIRQEGDADDIETLNKRLTAADTQISGLKSQVARMTWISTVMLGLVGVAGGALVTRLINGG